MSDRVKRESRSFDLALSFVPNRGNLFQEGVGTTPLNAATGNAAGPVCINTSAGNDASRWTNMFGAGLRYQQMIGAVDFKTFGLWEVSSKDDLTAGSYATLARNVAGRPAAITAGTLTTGNVRYGTSMKQASP
ncbi:MAG TPA: hypothetical protein VGM32_24815 [Rhodopila sp.]